MKIFSILILGFTEAMLPDAYLNYKIALEALNNKDMTTTEINLKKAIAIDPYDIELNQLLGSVYLHLSRPYDSLQLLKKATELSNGSNLNIVANYIEALRQTGNLDDAAELAHRTYAQTSDLRLLEILSKIEKEKGNHNIAIGYLDKLLNLNPKNMKAWCSLVDILLELQEYNIAERTVQEALEIIPEAADLHFRLGITRHHQSFFHDALAHYNDALRHSPGDLMVFVNMGAAYQALGQVEAALACYEKAQPHQSQDKGLLNNYGSLLGIMGRHREEVEFLQRALAVDPYLESALINLGSFYQDEGDIGVALEYFSRAAERNPSPVLRLRIALMESPVSHGWREMLLERNSLLAQVEALVALGIEKELVPGILGSYIDRIHFYIVYAGLNDRPIQCAISRAYQLFIKDLEYISPSLREPADETGAQQETTDTAIAIARGMVNGKADGRAGRVRVGFMSKYFGIFEPHGLLLDGVICNIPRDTFEVVVLAVARTDGKPLAPELKLCASSVHEVSLSLEHAAAHLSSLHLDILVLADVLSEPMNHFLAYSRFAPVQIAFWGNPITSCSPHIDYFVSADSMEFPFRTRLAAAEEPYSEQVVLLEGQGIWYSRQEDLETQLKKTYLGARIAPAANFTRADFSLSDEWFIFLCPQSVFKIHPLFDEVFVDILRAEEKIHIVVTGGRRQRWSDVYSTRLGRMLGRELSLRMHMIPRVSSEKFPDLLRLADAVLHPFPFDGSRTALDALEASIPFVTLPSEYLRGRMGFMYYRTMNVPELVAKNRTDYVRIAVDLASNPAFRNSVREKIMSRRYLLWEDMEYVYQWTRFLSRMSGIMNSSALSWETFIRSTGRDVDLETRNREQRAANQRAFEIAWGREYWMLDGFGYAHLPFTLADNEVPRIFKDWDEASDVGDSGSASSTKRTARISISELKIGQPVISLNERVQLLIASGELESAFELAAQEVLRLEGLSQSEISVRNMTYEWSRQVAHIQLMRGKYVDAIRILSSYCTHSPDSLEANAALATALFCAGHQSASISLLRGFESRRQSSTGTLARLTIANHVTSHDVGIVAMFVGILGSCPRCALSVDYVLEYLEFPPIHEGGDTDLLFSLIHLPSRSDSAAQVLRSMFESLPRPRRPSVSVEQVIQKLRNISLENYYVLIEAVSSWQPLAGAARSLTQHLNGLHDSESDFSRREEAKKIFVTTYYSPSPEAMLALLRNALNPQISKIFMLTNEKVAGSLAQASFLPSRAVEKVEYIHISNLDAAAATIKDIRNRAVAAGGVLFLGVYKTN